jgi:chromosome segregation ATPase
MDTLEAWFLANWLHIVYIVGAIFALAILICFALGVAGLCMIALRWFRGKKLAALEKLSEVLAEQQAQRGGELESQRQRIKQMEGEISSLKQIAILREKVIAGHEENLAGRMTALMALRKEFDASIAAQRREAEASARTVNEHIHLAKAANDALRKEAAEVDVLHKENDHLLTANTMMQRQCEGAEKQATMLSATLTDTNHQRDLLQVEVTNLREQVRLLKGSMHA